MVLHFYSYSCFADYESRSDVFEFKIMKESQIYHNFEFMYVCEE